MSCIKDNLHTDEKLEKMTVEDLNSHLVGATNSALKSITPITDPGKPDKLMAGTKHLLQQKHAMIDANNTNSVEFSKLQKSIRAGIREDIRKYDETLIEKAIERNSSRRSLKLQMSTGRKQIFKLLDEHGNVVTNRDEILNVTSRFYENLYKSRISAPQQGNANAKERAVRPPILNVGSEELPDITPEEIKLALRQLKNRRAPGEDSVLPEIGRASCRERV